jgi:hypothetical protein
MEDVRIFYGHLVYFAAIWYSFLPFGILWLFGTFSPGLVCCTKKNLATLIAMPALNMARYCEFEKKCQNHTILTTFCSPAIMMWVLSRATAQKSKILLGIFHLKCFNYVTNELLRS